MTYRPRVWAPHASTVALLTAAGTDAMEPIGDGWFEGRSELEPGARYQFGLDGTEPLPDPRSGWQPDGVHGPSCVVDHDSFAWTDDGWQPRPLADAVIYELHVGTFTMEGTYAAATDRLAHLVDLGITHVELLPIATFAGRHGWGYDGVDLFAPHPAYGSPDDLRGFVDAAHASGLAVLLDVVYNHLGPEGNYLGRFGPYFTDRYQTPWGPAVNLDGPGSDEVRRFFLDNARHWLGDYHFDGLRLDAVHALYDNGARHFLEELSTDVDAWASALGRPLVLIAENDTNDPRLVHARAVGGLGLDAHWCDDVHHVLHTAVTGESQGYYGDYDGRLSSIADALGHGYVYRGRYSPARGHTVGRPPDGVRGRQLVVALQNHDQIGNRARGDRLAQLAPERARAVAPLVLLSPFVPLLFQGEEWSASAPFPYFADHDDPDLVEAVRKGRQSEFGAFGWDPDDVLDPESEATFRLAQLDWDELAEGEHARTLDWYRALLALRHELAGELDDRLASTDVEADDERGTIVMRRGRLVVVCNLAAGPIDVSFERKAIDWRLSSDPASRTQGEHVELAASASLVGLSPMPS